MGEQTTTFSFVGDLKLIVLRRFWRTHIRLLYEQWLETNQTTLVVEYRMKLIEMVAPLDRISVTTLMGKSVNGLNEDLKGELRLLNQISLSRPWRWRAGWRNVIGFVDPKGPMWSSKV